MNAPLTLSLSDSDETRGRLWRWLVSMGIGYRRDESFPGWIPIHQALCCAAEAYLQERLENDRPIGDRRPWDAVPLRRRGDSVQYRSATYLAAPAWVDLCGVENLRRAAERKNPQPSGR